MDESALKILLVSLDSSRASLDSQLGWATFLVVVGVGLEWIFVIWEYREELHDFRRGVVHAPEKPNIRLFVLGLVATSLVTIGVAGEMYVGAKIGAVETLIRKANDERASLLSKLAGDAAVSAKTAHDEADAVKLEAAAIKKRLDAASQQLVQVEHTVRLQGPRWKLLMANRDEFVKAMQPFAGQKALVLTCGPRQTVPLEHAQLAQHVISLLNQTPPLGAGWKAYPKTWDSCPAVGPSGADGNLVTSSTDAPKAGKAATALADELSTLSINTINLPTDPKAEATVLSFFGPASAGELAIRNPDTVVFVVGPNPMDKPRKKP